MKVLVGCEESQEVCKAFRALGHEAYSCDLKPCSGGHPEWHITGDVLDYLNEGWDLLIGHPPCDHLSRVSIRWMNNPEKQEAQKIAIEFFLKMWNAPVPKICLENPRPQKRVWEMVGRWSQVIQPYYFGDRASKATCLWLKNLPKLIHFPHDNLLGTKTHTDKGEMRRGPNGKTYSIWSQSNNKKNRSKTFPGIAKAMAEQWGNIETVKQTA